MIFQHALLEAFDRHRERTALSTSQLSISYGELGSRSRRIARSLCRAGVGDLAIVGIGLKGRVDQIACMAGIALARGVFVLLDDAVPGKRMDAMLDKLQLEHVITSRTEDGVSYLERRPGLREYFIEDLLDAGSEAMDDEPGYRDDDALYVYFTSGSTGHPKGVVGKNESLLQFLWWEIAAFGIGEEARCSQLISPYFDAFLRDVFIPLLAGGRIVVPPAVVDLHEPEVLTSWIAREGVTMIHCVPSLFRQLDHARLADYDLGALRNVFLSGERIVPMELDSWYRHFGDRVQLVNFYGATETTMIRAFYPIRPEDVRSARISIGRPIADTTLIVLNKELLPCKPLVTGDLYIASRYISKGYLNDPRLTAERFLLLRLEGAEVPAFRTGDKARVLEDGSIELLGREDRQIKLRGIRIELDEIEHLLMGSQVLSDARVMKHGEGGEESLAAFVVPAAADDGSLVGRLNAHLLELLPSYMLPSCIVVMQEMPLLRNGKVDYKSLAAALLDREIVAPADVIEERLLTLWKDILGDKPVSVTESFQLAGGNSLSIMRLIGKIAKEFGVRISLSDLFGNLTIRKQAGLIRPLGRDDLFDIRPAPVKAAYPVSAAQERIYINYEVNKERTSYNLPLVWEIEGLSDTEKIETSIRALIRRHEALRTEFYVEDGQLVQRVLESMDFTLETEEMQREEEALQEQITRFIRPFDLNRAPLFRCKVLRGAGRKDKLLFDIHHIVCDGFSQFILFSDFLQCYRGREPAPLRFQPKDYAEWEAIFRSTREYVGQREFWLRCFDGEIPVVNWPTVNVSADDVSDRGGSLIFEIARERLEPLLHCSDDKAVTDFAGLYALFCIFLCRFTGAEDIVCAVTSSGRMQEEIQDVVGMFVKTLPIRWRIDPELSFAEMLRALNVFLIQATSHQLYDLTDILNELNRNRPTPVRSLFNVAFVFQNFQKKDTGGESFSTFRFENPNSKYPLTLYVSEKADAFVFRMEYSRAYFTPVDIRVVADLFIDIAARLAEDADARLLDILGSDNKVCLLESDITFNF